jgi:hypothetical protein
MEPTAAETAPPQRCRAVLTSGLQCLNRALADNDCCFEHSDHWFPTWPDEGEEIRIPLLQDEAAVRYLLTMVAHGVASKRLDMARARCVAYACQVVRSTFPRPAARTAKNPEEKPRLHEPVVAVERTPSGEPMAERQPYLGPTGAFEPYWSFAKYMFERECEMYRRPAPTCAADMPPSGWLTEEEMKEPVEDFNKRYNARNDRLRDEAKAWDLDHPEEARILAEERERNFPRRDPEHNETDQEDVAAGHGNESDDRDPPANIDLNASASGGWGEGVPRKLSAADLPARPRKLSSGFSEKRLRANCSPPERGAENGLTG